MNKAIPVLVKFKVGGNLRYLSHAETVRVFQRACVRAGIKLQYSEGFNPRPRLSLPLPRSVGVEAEDDLLSLGVLGWQKGDNRIELSALSFDAEEFRAALAEQLPEGFELLTVSVAKAKISPQPSQASYVLTVRKEYFDERLKETAKRLLGSENLVLQRRINAEGNIRNVDVRPFLKSIETGDGIITVDCKIGPEGTIRVDEILELLGLDVEKLAEPVRRTGVQWQQ